MFHFPVEERIYRTESTGAFRAFIFPSSNVDKLRPAIMFLHGAGFSTNKVGPDQFQQQASHFSALGFVSICVEYRPQDIEGLYSPIECLLHVKSAVRWVRENSSILGIDPHKIVLAGASAGGFLSLCSAMVEPFEDSSNAVSLSCVPDALVLFNGGVESQPLTALFPELAADLALVSPLHHIKPHLPPALFFHGTLDENVPYESVSRFVQQMKINGNFCELVSFEGMSHGFFNYGKHGNIPYHRTLNEMEHFLKEIMIM